MEYHYFTIEDIEMLTFNGIPHLHNHLNYLIHTDKDQKFTNEDSVRNVSFIFDNEGNSKALRWTDDLEKRIELKKYVFRYIRDLYKRLFYARVECPRRDVHNWNKYIFTAGMELNDFLKMEYLKDFQQGNVNILGVDGKKYISLEDLVNFDVDRYSEKCLNVVYENEKRESQMQEKIMQFHFNLEFVNKKYKNADVVLKVWATEICREQGLSDYYPVQDVKDAFKTMEYIDEKEAVEIVLNDSEETLIYHKSPEEEYFTREALKHETINFDKESEIEEDLDELEK